ncbi:MAG: SCP2 sterol-binding domain-containing protein [Candidatus Hermodarchaeota archaeon]
MIIINDPQDLLGLAVKNLLSPFLNDEKFIQKIRNWKKTVVVELKDLYPITIIFDNGEIRIEYDEIAKYHIKIIMNLNTFTDIAEGKLGIISAFLKRKVKIKKLYRIPTILKFKNILIPALKYATQQDNGN